LVALLPWLLVGPSTAYGTDSLALLQSTLDVDVQVPPKHGHAKKHKTIPTAMSRETRHKIKQDARLRYKVRTTNEAKRKAENLAHRRAKQLEAEQEKKAQKDKQEQAKTNVQLTRVVETGKTEEKTQAEMERLARRKAREDANAAMKPAMQAEATRKYREARKAEIDAEIARDEAARRARHKGKAPLALLQSAVDEDEQVPPTKKHKKTPMNPDTKAKLEEDAALRDEVRAFKEAKRKEEHEAAQKAKVEQAEEQEKLKAQKQAEDAAKREAKKEQTAAGVQLMRTEGMAAVEAGDGNQAELERLARRKAREDANAAMKPAALAEETRKYREARNAEIEAEIAKEEAAARARRQGKA